jgi:hypothetical protein
VERREKVYPSKINSRGSEGAGSEGGELRQKKRDLQIEKWRTESRHAVGRIEKKWCFPNRMRIFFAIFNFLFANPFDFPKRR